MEFSADDAHEWILTAGSLPLLWLHGVYRYNFLPTVPHPHNFPRFINLSPLIYHPKSRPTKTRQISWSFAHEVCWRIMIIIHRVGMMTVGRKVGIVMMMRGCVESSRMRCAINVRGEGKGSGVRWEVEWRTWVRWCRGRRCLFESDDDGLYICVFIVVRFSLLIGYNYNPYSNTLLSLFKQNQINQPHYL